MGIEVGGVEGVKALIGCSLPASPWFEVTQERVDAFGEATLDLQWIHVDPQRAETGPYGATVAHGLLTLALIPYLWRQVVRVDGLRLAVNYGFNRVRFPAPLPVPSFICATFRLEHAKDLKDGAQFVLHATIERRGHERPVCVADMIISYYS
ncbi:MAG: MaoC family dehydratase [Vulcanimicrobiaceae bacterium]